MIEKSALKLEPTARKFGGYAGKGSRNRQLDRRIEELERRSHARQKGRRPGDRRHLSDTSYSSLFNTIMYF
ncbi:hypothetical protein [Geomicrobium sp. JCM 19037]|uniref:hypothetical protein n=1 Tax=Geomicrobium sp. JCM 19037 TaxID=1460634 RepID=UPI0005A6FF36|nr:hypothetical protein [Geomicrobium sp. JCM 19037]